MKLLAFPSKKSGFTHELLKREGHVVLVQRHKKGRCLNLEVAVIRDMKPNQFIAYPYEKYPSSEDWGFYGFTFQPSHLVKAIAKFHLLASRYG